MTCATPLLLQCKKTGSAVNHVHDQRDSLLVRGTSTRDGSKEHAPMRKGRNLRIHWLLCCCGSALAGGEMTFWLMNWLTTSSTGSERYATAAGQPTGGAPSWRGTSHEKPPPWTPLTLHQLCGKVPGPIQARQHPI